MIAFWSAFAGSLIGVIIGAALVMLYAWWEFFVNKPKD